MCYVAAALHKAQQSSCSGRAHCITDTSQLHPQSPTTPVRSLLSADSLTEPATRVQTSSAAYASGQPSAYTDSELDSSGPHQKLAPSHTQTSHTSKHQLQQLQPCQQEEQQHHQHLQHQIQQHQHPQQGWAHLGPSASQAATVPVGSPPGVHCHSQHRQQASQLSCCAALPSIVLISMQSSGWASGIVLNKQGYILTNAHVIQPRSSNKGHDSHQPHILQSSIRVRLGSSEVNGFSWHDAEVIYVFHHVLDIAVIRLIDCEPSLLHPANLMTEPVTAGQAVGVVGYALFGPECFMGPSVTAGNITQARTLLIGSASAVKSWHAPLALFVPVAHQTRGSSSFLQLACADNAGLCHAWCHEAWTAPLELDSNPLWTLTAYKILCAAMAEHERQLDHW